MKSKFTREVQEHIDSYLEDIEFVVKLLAYQAQGKKTVEELDQLSGDALQEIKRSIELRDRFIETMQPHKI
jgi:hypothetical protein